MEIALIIGIVLVVLFAGGILIYNGLVQRRLRIDEALAQIEVQLKRRWDLIPNLVDAVKGYMGFEQKVLTEVTEARANAVAAGAQGPAEQAVAENALSSHAALALRGRRELPRPQVEPERPRAPGAADHDREPDQLRAPALQRVGPRLQHARSRPSPTSSSPGRSASTSASSSTPSRRPREPRGSTSGSRTSMRSGPRGRRPRRARTQGLRHLRPRRGRLRAISRPRPRARRPATHPSHPARLPDTRRLRLRPSASQVPSGPGAPPSLHDGPARDLLPADLAEQAALDPARARHRARSSCVLGYFAGYFFTGDAAGALLFIPLSIAVTAVLSGGRLLQRRQPRARRRRGRAR